MKKHFVVFRFARIVAFAATYYVSTSGTDIGCYESLYTPRFILLIR